MSLSPLYCAEQSCLIRLYLLFMSLDDPDMLLGDSLLKVIAVMDVIMPILIR